MNCSAFRLNRPAPWLALLCALILPLGLRGAPLRYALDFDGVDDGVDVTFTAPPTNSYTIGAWVYLRSGGSGGFTQVGAPMAVLSSRTCGGSVELVIRSSTQDPNDPQYLELRRCDPSSGDSGYGSSALPVPLRVWTHVAVTVSAANQVSYFINGEFAGSMQWPGSDLAIGTNVTFGNGNRRFDGRLDEVLIASEALDAETIKNFYNANFKGDEFPFFYALYHFDEGSGNQVADSAPAGGSANGTLNNGPVWVPSGPPAPVALTVAGTQQDLGGAWRSMLTAKTLDVDGDNVLGTDGYELVNLPPVRPTYLASMEILTGTYPGNDLYAQLDDPVNFGSTFQSATMSPGPGAGNSADLFKFTLNQQALGRLIRVGLLVDNLDDANYNAASWRLVQTVGGTARSSSVSTTSTKFKNRKPDWIFFDVVGGQPGDAFVVRGVAGVNGQATLGGVAFDSLGAVGGKLSSVDFGPAGPYPSRLLVSSVGADIGRMTLTVNQLKASSPGLGLLLVGPGGQKVRPLVNAPAGFDPVNGVTLTFDDTAADVLPTPLEGTIPSGTYRPQSDQGGAGDLPAPAPAGPYPSTLSSGFAGPVNGVWSLYAAGAPVRIGSWSLTFVPSPPPVVTTLAATAITPSSATLNAAVNPNGLETTVWFTWASRDFLAGPGAKFGPTSETTKVTLGRGSFTPVNLSALLTGLSEASEVQVQAVASTVAGTTYGAPQKFLTGTSRVWHNGDSGWGSLRQVLEEADPGAVVTFDGSLSGQTIRLSTGPLVLNRNLSIDASALPRGIIINGDHKSGLFDSIAGITNVLTALTITDGQAALGAGGGGIVSRGNLTLNGCTLSGNFASLGGGVYNEGTLTLNGCTLAGNSSAASGGGIWSKGAMTVNQSTLSGNSALGGAGGGIHALVQFGLNNSIVAGNTSAFPEDGSILGSFVGNNNLIDGDPRLGPLADNGGLTWTMALLEGSPAIDTGMDFPGSSVAFDQRGPGYPRRSGAGVDIGAYEFQQKVTSLPPVLVIDATPQNAAPGLYLSWQDSEPGTPGGGWRLFRKSSLDDTSPWEAVPPTQVLWNSTNQRWRFVSPFGAQNAFYRLGR